MSLKKEAILSPCLKHWNTEQFFLFYGHKEAVSHSLKSGAYSNLSTIYKYHRHVCWSESIVLPKATMEACSRARLWPYFPFFRLKSQSRIQYASNEHNPKPFCLPSSEVSLQAASQLVSQLLFSLPENRGWAGMSLHWSCPQFFLRHPHPWPGSKLVPRDFPADASATPALLLPAAGS